MRLFLAAFLWLSATSPVAAQAPGDLVRLSGRFDVDPRAGTLGGDVCLFGVGGSRRFLLNRGLNIREVRDAATNAPLGYEGFYDARNTGDATPYTLEGEGGREGYCVSYVGAFPIYRVDAGERAAVDWKGQIAFDGLTVRATEQTRFYPVPITEGDEALDQLAFDVEVNCRRCDAIYVNGAAPARGPRARFRSDLPRMMLLYAGELPYSSVGGAHFVGATVSPEAAATIGSGLATIRAAHEAYLGVGMSDAPAMMSFAAVGRNRTLGRNTWGFATWPTIASDGRLSFDRLAEGSSNGRLEPERERYLAHEMGHHYFGARYMPRGPLRWFMLESTAEYLAAQAVRRLQGQEAYERLLSGYVNEVPQQFVPLNQVTEVDQINYGYRYMLGPLLFAAMANAAGEAPVRDLLAGLVREPPREPMDYVAFRRRLLAAGAAEAAVTRFEAACMSPQLTADCRALAGVRSGP